MECVFAFTRSYYSWEMCLVMHLGCWLLNCIKELYSSRFCLNELADLARDGVAMHCIRCYSASTHRDRGVLSIQFENRKPHYRTCVICSNAWKKLKSVRNETWVRRIFFNHVSVNICSIVKFCSGFTGTDQFFCVCQRITMWLIENHG